MDIRRTESPEKKQKRKLPVQAYLLYLLLAVFLVTGVTFSRYLTTTNGGDSARVVKIGGVTLSESGDFYETGKLRMIPGVNLTKKASVSFEGSETACYLFIEVMPTGWATADNYTFTASAKKLSWSVGSDWTHLTADGGKYVYYTVLAPNTTVTDKDIIADNTVTVSPLLKNSDLSALPADLSVAFSATTVQYDGFGAGLSSGYTETEHAMAAWNSVKTK